MITTKTLGAPRSLHTDLRGPSYTFLDHAARARGRRAQPHTDADAFQYVTGKRTPRIPANPVRWSAADIASPYALREFSAAQMLVHGTGGIGGKARNLLEKSRVLRACGFLTPPRHVLAEEVLTRFLQRNRIADNLAAIHAMNDADAARAHAQILAGAFTHDELALFTRMIAPFADGPVAIRSSGIGDALGHGTYTSAFVAPTLAAVARAIKNVIASFVTPDARAFVKLAQQKNDGWGVLIEPVIGHWLNPHPECTDLDTGATFDDRLFTPLLSGHGFTTDARGDCTLKVVAGLGGGVFSRHAQRVTAAEYGDHDHFGQWLTTISLDHIQARGRRIPLASAYAGKNDGQLFPDASSITTFSADTAAIEQYTVQLQEIWPKGARHTLDLRTLFTKFAALEACCGTRQYVEWAMIGTEAALWYATQIADMRAVPTHPIRALDYGNLQEYYFVGDTVTGHGTWECGEMVYCAHPNDLALLSAYNTTHRNYVLLYTAQLTTRLRHSDHQRLQLADFSNAAVIIEIANAEHSGDPTSHFEGQLDLTGKAFAVLRNDPPPQWDAIAPHKTELRGAHGGTLVIYPVATRVTADHLHDRLVVQRAET